MSDAFERKAFSGRPLDHCFIVDAHAHLSENPNVPLPDVSLKTLIERMDFVGVDVFCCSAIAAIYNQQRYGNDIIIDAVRRYPKRIFGYMALDVGYPERVVPEMERCLAAGLRGIKIYSHSIHAGFNYNDPVFKPVFEFANAHGLPLKAHTFSLEELGHMEQHFNLYPRVNFVMAHAGSCGASPYVRLAKTYTNVYIETCFSLCPRGFFETLVGDGVTDKVLWGSDSVFMDETQQIGRVVFAQIPEEAKRRILGENAVRALGLVKPA